MAANMLFSRSAARSLTTTSTSFLQAQCSPGPGIRQPISRPSTQYQTTSSSNPSGTRSFHIASTITSTIDITQNALVALHTTTGLPWYLAIPTFALGVNLVFRLPFQAWSRCVAVEQMRLQPLLVAWKNRHDAVFRDAGKPTTAVFQMAKTKKRIFRERGVQAWKVYTPLLGIAPWLVTTEAIRRMVGAGGGILSMILGRREDGNQGQGHGASGTGAAMDDASPIALVNDTATVSAAPAAPAESAAAVGTAAETTTATATTTLDAASDAVVNGVEQSMTTGGILWFPDLTAADPYTVLPMALSGIMIYTFLPRDPALLRRVLNLASTPAPGEPSALTKSMTWRLRFTRILLFTSVAIPLVAINIPSGMMLYWVCSSAFGQITAGMLDRRMPKPQSQPRPAMKFHAPSLHHWKPTQGHKK